MLHNCQAWTNKQRYVAPILVGGHEVVKQLHYNVTTDTTATDTSKGALTVLEVVEENMETLTLNTVVLDNDARAADDLTGVTLTVNLAETSPGTENLRVANLDEVDLVVGAESLDELDVFGFRAGLDENAKMGLALVQGLGGLTETAGKSIVDKGIFQDLLEGILNGHLTLRSLSSNFGDGGLNGNFISSVRHLF